MKSPREEKMMTNYGQEGVAIEAPAPEDDWDLPQPARPRSAAIYIATQSVPVKNMRETEKIALPAAKNYPLRLPSFFDPDRCPAFMARSALFSSGRTVLGIPHDGPVKAQGKYALTLCGERLYMRDKQVWHAVMNIVKRAPAHNVPIRIELAAIATLMGSSDHCGGALRRIWQSVERLSRATIEVTLHDGHAQTGKLVAAAYRQEKKYFIEMDMPWMAAALSLDYQFKVNCGRRNGLAYSLAQWLHDFLSTHKSFPGLTIGYIRELCGFEGQQRTFPAMILTALTELRNSATLLVADFEIIRNGKSSDSWTVVITHGPEQPSYSAPSWYESSDEPNDLSYPTTRRVAL
ncbi:hypothetical protein OX462_12170 [Janthinobacterium sp. SUN098]|uniref:hypothetical protein n=1 Tax=Janthinobacterium sp. SUN098 TaxID=3002437 RepID=UPI0038D46699